MLASIKENFANTFPAKPLILVSSKYHLKYSKGKIIHPKNTSKAALLQLSKLTKVTLDFHWQYRLFQKPQNTGMHVGIQNLLSQEQNLNVSHIKLILISLKVHFAFQKKTIKSSFFRPITEQQLEIFGKMLASFQISFIFSFKIEKKKDIYKIFSHLTSSMCLKLSQSLKSLHI